MPKGVEGISLNFNPVAAAEGVVFRQQMSART
jgi:hypothetical protein